MHKSSYLSYSIYLLSFFLSFFLTFFHLVSFAYFVVVFFLSWFFSLLFVVSFSFLSFFSFFFLFGAAIGLFLCIGLLHPGYVCDYLLWYQIRVLFKECNFDLAKAGNEPGADRWQFSALPSELYNVSDTCHQAFCCLKSEKLFPILDD